MLGDYVKFGHNLIMWDRHAYEIENDAACRKKDGRFPIFTISPFPVDRYICVIAKRVFKRKCKTPILFLYILAFCLNIKSKLKRATFFLPKIKTMRSFWSFLFSVQFCIVWKSLEPWHKKGYLLTFNADVI